LDQTIVKPKNKKTSQKQKDVSFLTRWGNRGIAKIHGQGFDFLKDDFLPAIERLAENAKTKVEKEVVADSYYFLGDIYDFNDAPKAAIRAYRKGITFFPYPDYASGFHREIGHMHDTMGKYKTAIKYIKKALKIYEDDEHAQSDLEFAELSLKRSDPPLYKAADWKWAANELLAQNKPKKALQVLLKRKSVKAAQLRARAYGILNDQEDQLDEWKKIEKLKSLIEFDYADWFFLCEKNFESVEFWKVLHSLRKRISEGGIFIHHDSLYENYYQQLGSKRLRNEIIGYQIAKFSKNAINLKRLSKKYPKWLEPKHDLVKLLRKKK